MGKFASTCYEKWKKLPCWFGIGLLFVVIDILFFVIAVLIFHFGSLWEFFHLPYFVIFDPLCGLVSGNIPICGFIYDIAIGLIGVFILGAIIGIILEAIKQKRKKKYPKTSLVVTTILVIGILVLILLYPYFYIRAMNATCIIFGHTEAAGFACIPFASVLELDEDIPSVWPVALPALRQGAGNRMMTDMGRKLFMEFLEKDKEATSILIKIAGDKSESEFVRDYAIHTLGLINDPRAVDVLIKLLEDESNELRVAAAGALSRISEIPGNVTGKAAISLIEMLREGPENLGRRAIIPALGNIKAVGSIEYLVPFLHDPDRCIRSDTAKALGEIRNKTAFIPLKEVFAIEKDDWTKAEMAIALAKFGDDESFKYLLNELKQPAGCVEPKATIARGLGEIGNSEAIEPLLKEYELTKEEKSCIYDDIHVAIGRSLIMLGSPKGIPILENFLARHDLYIMEIAQDTLDNKEKWLGQERNNKL